MSESSFITILKPKTELQNADDSRIFTKMRINSCIDVL